MDSFPPLQRRLGLECNRPSTRGRLRCSCRWISCPTMSDRSRSWPRCCHHRFPIVCHPKFLRFLEAHTNQQDTIEMNNTRPWRVDTWNAAYLGTWQAFALRTSSRWYSIIGFCKTIWNEGDRTSCKRVTSSLCWMISILSLLPCSIVVVEAPGVEFPLLWVVRRV